LAVDGANVWLASSTLGGTNLGVARSADHGATWVSTTVGHQWANNIRIAANGTAAAISFTGYGIAGGSTVAVTRNGGATWSIRARANRAPIGGVWLRGQTVAIVERDTAATHPVLSLSRDAGGTWDPDLPLVHAPDWFRLFACRDSLGLVSNAPTGIGTEVVHMQSLFGNHPYGVATSGSGGIAPELTLAGEPLLGRTGNVDLDRCVGGTLGLVVLSLLGPGSVPFGGGQLLVNEPYPLFWGMASGPTGVPGAGSMSFPFTIPALPLLRGLRTNWQAFAFDPGAAAGFTSTAGIESWMR
jgi:hypothetical protein